MCPPACHSHNISPQPWPGLLQLLQMFLMHVSQTTHDCRTDVYWMSDCLTMVTDVSLMCQSVHGMAEQWIGRMCGTGSRCSEARGKIEIFPRVSCG
ncbi:hypothetical protein V8C86DRAFT_2453140 [Haematococcus lacustris]